MLRRVAALLAVGSLLFACSSSSTGSTSSPAAAATPPADPPADDPPAEPPPPPADACGTVAKSLCTPANPGSVIRGVVKFDASQYATGKKPTLRVFLHHQWTLMKDEDKHGGHPHAYTSSDDVDLAKGEARFSLDLCELGTAMWSEENCGFNLVAILDTTGDNDPDTKGQLAFIAKPGALAKMMTLDVSCHAASPCLDITADCKDGETCTTYSPITSCKCSATTCPSDDKYCKP